MGAILKEATIYICLIIVCCNYTIILPFFPKLAEDKGLSISLIGTILSINPFVNLISTFFLKKYMKNIGRKKVLISSLAFTVFSALVLSSIEKVNYTGVIVLSLLSKMLVGLSLSCIFVSVSAIFAVDYPEKLQIMLGRMEASISAGLFIGPLIGAFFEMVDLFISLLIFGSFVCICIPIF